jgi:hypothetical protein
VKPGCYKLLSTCYFTLFSVRYLFLEHPRYVTFL